MLDSKQMKFHDDDDEEERKKGKEKEKVALKVDLITCSGVCTAFFCPCQSCRW